MTKYVSRLRPGEEGMSMSGTDLRRLVIIGLLCASHAFQTRILMLTINT